MKKKNSLLKLRGLGKKVWKGVNPDDYVKKLRDEWCKHDYTKPIRLGRAHWVCKKCRKDITLELVFIEDAISSHNM